ncbi:uncharacterized protein BDZ99DRAFT_517107 [Mytilinidion resinicola]|uniref:Uncharacterized protein n=1 Tax=Mytilinidion resinicola TaxID=574789 RepID=A0A6A6YVG6_9PEZI|nr:uncharacterized protein BDZ99DRAFT_517107 [Mytilinidion resinicola]KAF2812791.1 hypothetical protein BDZ99DRAFT_517107 [Mytilinidion resinicola]
MTSRPDNPPTTTASQDLLIDCLDIVATQGAYLVPRAGTPVSQEAYDGQFATALKQHLDAVITEQICRSVMYHGAADEWPMGHTPPEYKEKRKAELKAHEELEGATSDDGSDNDDDDKDKGGNDIDARVGPGKPVAAPDRPQRPRRPRQADWLPTPPLSAESPLATPYRRKRRRMSEEDEEEKERPAKKHVSFAQEVSAAAEDAVPNTARQKSRKRRRTLDVGDEEEGDKKRPSKVRVTTTRPSSVWLQRLRPRPR